MGFDPRASVAPGPGTFVLVDHHGARIRPWQESSTRPERGGSRFADPEEVVGSTDLRPLEDRLAHTAPKVVKTSGLSKATRLTKTWEQHFALWQAMLGRPMVVGDLSPQMRRAFHMDRYKDDAMVTKRMVGRAAQRYLAESERQMRAEQDKRVTKEAFYVPAGVR